MTRVLTGTGRHAPSAPSASRGSPTGHPATAAQRQVSRSSGTPRQRWAVDTLAVVPDDRVLEIGCGQGAAVSLVAGRLRTGRITAIDRSAAAVRVARRRNAAHLERGVAEIERVDVGSADFAEGSFDKVFAVNLSLFWLGTPPGLLERTIRLLARGGRLYLINERPTPAVGGRISDRIRTSFAAHGLHSTSLATTSRRGWHLTAVITHPTPGA